MNIYISIFPNTDPSISSSICIAAGKILAEDKQSAIKQTISAVPYTWPFLVVEKTSYDKIFHNAYEPDWSNPDGYGTNKNMQLNFVAMGYLENW
jgi:hypothetical protein